MSVVLFGTFTRLMLMGVCGASVVTVTMGGVVHVWLRYGAPFIAFTYYQSQHVRHAEVLLAGAIAN